MTKFKLIRFDPVTGSVLEEHTVYDVTKQRGVLYFLREDGTPGRAWGSKIWKAESKDSVIWSS